jgi:hypothetical protein
MTDDLVARLRLISAWKTPGGPMPTEDMVNPHITCAEAADRIEQLEAALRRIVTMTPDPEFGAFPIESAIDVARAALDGT